MKIYVAGSFKNGATCRLIGEKLREERFDAYVFCDEKSPAYPHSIAIRNEGLTETFTPKTALDNAHVKDIYAINMMELAKADVVLMVLPCGNSAHMEAGFIKGLDGKLIIYGPLNRGQFDAMYGMADGVYNINMWLDVVSHLKVIQQELEVGV